MMAAKEKASARSKSSDKDDLARLQGTWDIATLEMDGAAMPPMGQIILKGDNFTAKGMGPEYRGKLKLDPAKKPKQFELHFTAGPEKGNTSLGIYELGSDTWKICLSVTSKLRPTKFATAPGSGHAFETLTRATGKTKSASLKIAAAAPKRGAASKTPPTEFEGEWQVVSGVMNGQPMDKSMVQWVKRVTVGNVSTVLAGPQVMLKVEFTYDPSQSPKTIDYFNLAGANKGKSQQGIYAFENGLLKICVAAPGDARPAEFESAPGANRTLTVWKRSGK
jgi:uncharacterized protein (TIGR03067 family)